MVKKNNKTSKGTVWVILAMLAVIGIPIGLYYMLMLGIANQPGEPREDPRESLRAAAPEWTPDGSLIVFGHEGSVYVLNQDGSALNRIHGSGREDDLYHTPTLSGDGSRIVYSEYQGGERWERLSSALDGSDVRETDQNFDDRRFNDPWGYAISSDRSRIVFVETKSRLNVLYVSEYPREENKSSWNELVIGDSISIGSPRWSPDGSRIAFVELSRVDNDSVQYLTRVVSPNGSGLETVHQSVVKCGRSSICVGYEVTWSPDGTKLLVSGFSSISVVNADGSGSMTLVKLQDNPIRQLHSSWSPDGSMIAVYNGNAHEGVLFTMSPDGSNKRVLTEYGDPLRLAQDQSWNPAFNAPPDPTPAPSATPNPATSASPKSKNPSAPLSTPTPAHGIVPPTTRADTPNGAKDPRMARDIGGFDPTAPIRGGAAYGHSTSWRLKRFIRQ